MKPRIIPVLILWALLAATGIANAQVETTVLLPDIQTDLQTEPKESQPDVLPPPTQIPQPESTATETTRVVAPLTQVAQVGEGGNCASSCGGCHGSCWDRFTKWLCYKALPVPPCACQRVCRYDYYPRIYTYFLLPSAFTGGSSPSPGCQNCWGNR